MKKIIFISCCILFSGCEDFLNVEPDEQISTSEQLSTATGVSQAFSGIYRDVEEYLSNEKSFVYGDAIAGNYSFTPSISNQGLTVPENISLSYTFNNQAENSDFESSYSDGYNIINQVNILLENLDSFTFFEPERLMQLEGELLAIRAFIHYRHSLYFAQNYNFSGDGSHLGIVYNTQTLKTGVDFPRRATLAQNYESMKQDLDAALELQTTNSFLENGTARSYFNPISTRAVYAQIALQMNDWQTAADYADEVINGSGVELVNTSNYVSEWTAASLPSEYLLSFTAPLDRDGSIGSSIGAYFQYNSSQNYNDYVASNDLIQSYETGDLRLSLFETISLPTKIDDQNLDVPYYFTKKYAADSNTPYLRLTELYLIKAEALERLAPGNQETITIINSIRNRVQLPNLSSGTNILDAILKERRLELAFENSYFFDLARYGSNIERGTDCQLYTNICNLNYPSPYFIQPIPLESIQNNENMIQNDGY